MIDYQVYDEFMDKLPEITFEDTLSLPQHINTPPNWNSRSAREGEIFISGISPTLDFPDEEGLLEVSYRDFSDFLSMANIRVSDNEYPLALIKDEHICPEGYKINVTKEGITIFSADTEGIRRALIYIEDEMYRREGSFLLLGEIAREPFVKERISRCYFTPASHAEIEEKENELCDERDYYPDGYLNRLMHDGINALWLGASLKYLVKTPLVGEYGVDSERRIKKLNSVIEKCRKYGIKVYLFAVDPASSFANPALLSHPELIDDNEGAEYRLVCPSQKGAVEYLTEAVKSLFNALPHLAGYINLTVGESLSTCASNGASLSCTRCKRKFGSVATALAFVEKVIADAIHEVSPDAKYISWTYEMRNWSSEDIELSCMQRDEGVIHLQNFEDYGRPIQLGKPRVSYDYWLSYPGPGELFAKTLEYNKRANRKTYAKIQVCSSHEISTVPYVITPGILYDKYKYFLENGIEGVMQCWFFGNYPCLMNKAAGELSFLPFPKTKEEFLSRLAGIYWGADCERVKDAWLCFERGYRNYPVSVSFEWLGPMQDGPVSPLHLLPIDRPMPSSWLATDPVGGDRIGECILNGHTHEEILELTERMYKYWSEGVGILAPIPDYGFDRRAEQKSVAEATALIFKSGYNILKFYYLRRLLGIGSSCARQILEEMRKIVIDEMENSEKLIKLCERDNRIGYHSEAHGHKIFPEKLRWRIEKLETLLSTEFEEVAARIKEGKAPLEFYTGVGSAVVYRVGESGAISLVTQGGDKGETQIKLDEVEGGYKLTIYAQSMKDDYIIIKPEPRIFHPSAPILISKTEFTHPVSRRSFFTFANSYKTFSIHPDDLSKELSAYNFNAIDSGNDSYTFTLFIDRERFGMEKGEPFRLDIERYECDKHYDLGCTAAKEALHYSDKLVTRLIHGTYSPECYALIIPKK